MRQDRYSIAVQIMRDAQHCRRHFFFMGIELRRQAVLWRGGGGGRLGLRRGGAVLPAGFH